MNRIKHLRSNIKDKKPSTSFLNDGEIALNTNNASEALFFKNNNNDIVEIKSIKHISNNFQENKIVEISTEVYNGILDVNTTYVFRTAINEITIQNFNNGNKIVGIYTILFKTSNTMNPILNLPSYVLWANNCPLELEMDTEYELSISHRIDNSGIAHYKIILTPFK